MRVAIIGALAASLVLATGALGQSPNPPGWEAFAATYDGNLPLLLKGKITSADWSGLRASLVMEHIEAGNAPVAWKVDLGVTSMARERGFDRDKLTPGKEIIVRGYQAKDRSQLAAARDITFADGRRTVFGSSTGAPRD